MSIDNPTYFYNPEENNSPKTPDSPNRRFFFFRRHSSSGNKLISPTKSTPKCVPHSPTSTLPPPGGSCKDHQNKRNFRSLLRSKSTNSGCIYSQILPPSEAGSITNCQENAGFRYRLGSYNESITYGNNNDDVFYRSNSSNYSGYNPGSCSTDSTVTELRRHSVGTFGRKARVRSSSFSDEVPKIPAPKPPKVATTLPRRCDNMDDILVITSKESEHGSIWFNHLKTCFDNITKQRGRLPFNFLHIKIDDGQITPELSIRSKQTKLQIVIICPALTQLPCNYLNTQLGQLIKSEIAIGMYLDLNEEKRMEFKKIIFPLSRKWREVEIQTNDQSPLSELIGSAVDILGRALREQPAYNDAVSPAIVAKAYHQDHFTILPRKIKSGHNKVVIMLTDPLTIDDSIRIKLEKSSQNGEVVQFKKRNPYTIQLTVPESYLEISAMIGIRIEKNGVDIGCKPVKCESKLKEIEQLLKSQDSPVKYMCHCLGLDATADHDKLDLYLVQSFQKNVPPNFDLLTSVHEKVDFMGYKEARAEEFPTMLHFAAKFGFERLCLQLVEFPGGVAACDLKNVMGKTPEEIAEEEKHQKIASYLKYFSQMHRVTRMYDYVAGMSKSPAEVTTSAIVEKVPEADKSTAKETESDTENNNKVAPIDYMQMNGSGVDTTDSISLPVQSSSNVKSVENLSDELGEILTNELKITELDYFDSNEINKSGDEFSQNCMNVLESAHSDYIFQPSNIPVPERSQSGFDDYLVQPSNIPINTTPYPPPATPSNQSECGDYLVQPSNRKVEVNYENEPTHMYLSFKKSQDQLSASTTKLKTNSLRRQGSDISKASVDDELAEIINDFKNNVFTIQEVEQLVASWKNRNDVQQSFKDKQDQLQKMREEYDRIQSQMKEKLKRPTPFERMKKLFSRSKPNVVECKESVKGDSGDANGLQSPKSTHRPRSSLSLQSISSSSSSGRMSTGSACSGTSLGDSGTHSDHEERRNAFTSSCQIGHPGSLMENYMIPPAPRPVTQHIHTPASTPTPNEEKVNPFFPTINHQHHPSTPNYSEHYIMFPSNTPVYQTPPNHNHHDYLNFPAGLNTIVETPNETCVSIQPIKIQSPQPIYSQSTKGINTSCSSFKSAASPASNNFNDNLVKYDGKYNTNNFNIVSKDGDKKSSGPKLDRQILNINNCDYENVNGSDCSENNKSEC